MNQSLFQTLTTSWSLSLLVTNYLLAFLPLLHYTTQTIPMPCNLYGFSSYLLDLDFSLPPIQWCKICLVIYQESYLLWLPFPPCRRVQTKWYSKWFSSHITYDCKRLRTVKRSCNLDLKQSRITALEKSTQPKAAIAKTRFEPNLKYQTQLNQ